MGRDVEAPLVLEFQKNGGMRFMKITKTVSWLWGALVCIALFAAGISQVGRVSAAEDVSDDDAPKEVTWEEPNKAVFNHAYHVEEVGLDCDSCHDDLFEMEIGAASAKKDFTMASFKEGKYCGACHNGDDAFDAQTQCDSCHFAPKGRIVFTKPVNAVVFEHKIHVGKAKVACEKCHKEVFVMRDMAFAGLKPIETEDPAVKRKYLRDLHERFCGTCHDSNQAFGFATRCTVCHIGVKGLKLLQKNGHEKVGQGEH